MVVTDAWSDATCDSSAIVTRSRKRRCTRVDTVRRNHVATPERPIAMAAKSTRPRSCSSTPLPRSVSHTATSASGNAASSDRAKATTMSAGSRRYPSLHSRHMEDSAGGRSSTVSALASREDIEGHLLLAFERLSRDEPFRLHGEHRVVAPGGGHELVVRSQFDHPPVLEDTDAVGVADRGEAMGDQDRRALAGRGQDAV